MSRPAPIAGSDTGSPAQWLNHDCSEVSREVFTSEAIYRREQQTVFRNNWLYVAHESQLKNPGDFVAAYMGEVPVIVARDRDGSIAVSVNSCPHRGLRVCRTDQGNTARFICPYHTWAFKPTGELVGIPQARKMGPEIDRSRYRLKAVPRVESIFGLIFASFDAQVEPLADYLGDHRFYMEAFFDRFPGGLEVIGPVHKWNIKCNWKLPVENMLGDIGHAAYLHGTLVDVNGEANQEIENLAVTAVARPGHAAAFRYLPEDSTLQQRAVHNPQSTPELAEYLTEVERTVAERLSPVQARMKGMALGVYPNLSLLWGQHTLRVSHPRAPGLIEYWSWLISPIEAPASVKKAIRAGYTVGFGPSGIIEQEDSYAWSEQYIGSSIDYLNDTPYYYGMGVGEEGAHPDLPGQVGRTYNEHYARSFYQRWREDVLAQEMEA
ncbi:aromatic ring-hydroxylating dioxygenase subunit alpha [Mangrovimicrobium sediminis]|uniref:Aromatic ring-hydroxylating dioxygenase subunit alpha n=1 Tax=Mangrovimicrobium sediminis TaxID=2562682 RepID=A0A4Z0M1Y3_9GAMM|nr:aromatic ring-hydroxylating dioxygenase subunit alpha [Haliea sp. SAOS-164]TGD73551.1 aromatic ring-hydroxylating dioxygenase subunit alpha [Haliea sp. SAOS-164]